MHRSNGWTLTAFKALYGMFNAHSHLKVSAMLLKPLKNSNPRNNRAFTLLEVSLALALAGSAMVYALYQKEEIREEEVAVLEAEQLLEIQGALEKYLKAYEYQLLNNENIAITDAAGNPVFTLLTGTDTGETRNPTLNNLKALQLLSSTAAVQTAVDSKAYLIGVINATQEPDTAVDLASSDACKLQPCKLTAYVYTNGALGVTAQSPELNRKRIARVMNKLGAKGIETLGSSNELFTSSNAIIANVTEITAVRGIVGAYASTQTLVDVRSQPIANRDYCPAGVWEFNSSSVSNALPPEGTANPASNCYAAHGDIPVGLQALAYDTDGTLKGKVTLLCTRATGSLMAELVEHSLEVHTAITARSCGS